MFANKNEICEKKSSLFSLMFQCNQSMSDLLFFYNFFLSIKKKSNRGNCQTDKTS